MTTWISKTALAGALCLALAACEDIAGVSGAQDNGLPSASLARGAVSLVPPVGYCIDKRTIRARFALMARCDTLGGTATFGAPLAVITAATVDQSAVDASRDANGETILSRRSGDALTLLEINGTPPTPDMRPVFWRAVGLVGDQVIGLAIYEGENGEPLGERAPQLLRETMQRTRARSAVQSRSAQDNSATTLAKP